MRNFSQIAEMIFFVTLFGYLYLVAIKEMIGTPFIPVHDGLLLVLAMAVGFVWVVLPNSWSQKQSTTTTLEPTFIALLALQIIIILQAGSQKPQSIELLLTILGTVIYVVGATSFMTNKDLQKIITKIPKKGQISFSLQSLPIYTKGLAMLGLGLLTIFPWGYWALTRVGLPVHPLTALIGAAIVLVMVALVRYYSPKPLVSNASVIKTTEDMIPNPVKLGIHYLSLVTVFGVLLGVAYYAYAFQKPTEEVLIKGATFSITETSTGWTILDGGVYSTEAAFFPNQFLKFSINVEETGVYRPTFLAEVSDLGGQIAFEVEKLGSGGVEESGELLPFQCSFWIEEEIYEVFLKDNGCPEFPREIELTPVKLEEGEAYQLTIRVTDQFPTRFNEPLQVNYGGYIQLQDFEMRKQ